MDYIIPRGTQAVMGIPVGKLQNLDARVAALETNGAGLNVLTTGSTINDSNVTFVFSKKPTLVFVNGTGYRENHGWTGTATVTLDNAVGAGGDIYALG